MPQRPPKDLPSFLHDLRSSAPQDIVTVKREVDPRLELAAARPSPVLLQFGSLQIETCSPGPLL